MSDEKRYQVFVSSTFEDLIEERREVTQALLELDCIPSGMELFPAADNDQWTLIQKVIDDCDYYILITAGRYGSIGPKSISYTEMEYRYALEKRKPIISFLFKNLQKLPLEKSEKEASARQKLASFQELVTKKMVKHYSSSQELGSLVSRSIVKLIKTNPAVGWIRGDKAIETAAYKELADLRRQLDATRQASSISIDSKEIAELLQGAESFEIECTIEYSDKYTFESKSYDWHTTVSINEIFGSVAPLLMSDANSSDLQQKLSEYMKKREWDDIEKDEMYSQKDFDDFYINSESFDTICIQMLALGLIQRRKSGSNLRFGLTEYGEKEMYQLRALKRTK